MWNLTVQITQDFKIDDSILTSSLITRGTSVETSVRSCRPFNEETLLGKYLETEDFILSDLLSRGQTPLNLDWRSSGDGAGQNNLFTFIYYNWCCSGLDDRTFY